MKKPQRVGAAQITSILHPTDFSESSARAFDWAVLLAQTTGAKVHLLHVVGFPEEVQVDEKALRNAVAAAEKRLSTLSGGPDVDGGSRAVRIGAAHVEIVAQARELGVDMVVMGSVGSSGEAAVGSTAEKVVRALGVPVLTVKSPPAKAKKAGRVCSMCGKPSPDVICEPCKDRVCAEASSRRRRD